jgi:hypothetical protein
MQSEALFIIMILITVKIFITIIFINCYYLLFVETSEIKLEALRFYLLLKLFKKKKKKFLINFYLFFQQ